SQSQRNERRRKGIQALASLPFTAPPCNTTITTRRPTSTRAPRLHPPTDAPSMAITPGADSRRSVLRTSHSTRRLPSPSPCHRREPSPIDPLFHHLAHSR
ncbi:hypothetical protein U1Q18_038085, partial [Sarracenia purpurea var. burkii]